MVAGGPEDARGGSREKNPGVFPAGYLLDALDAFSYDAKAAVNSYLAGNSGGDLDILSRIIFEGLHLSIITQDKRQIAISAKNAVINIMLDNIKFSGDVKISSDHGFELSAPLVPCNK